MKARSGVVGGGFLGGVRVGEMRLGGEEYSGSGTGSLNIARTAPDVRRLFARTPLRGKLLLGFLVSVCPQLTHPLPGPFPLLPNLGRAGLVLGPVMELVPTRNPVP